MRHIHLVADWRGKAHWPLGGEFPLVGGDLGRKCFWIMEMSRSGGLDRVDFGLRELAGAAGGVDGDYAAGEVVPASP